MLNVLSAVCFAGFVLAAVSVLVLERTRPPARRGAVSAFLIYYVAASFGAGLSQHDAWPFSKWALAATPGVAAVTTTRIVGLDPTGGEHDIDYRAWEPVATDELVPWMQIVFPGLGRVAQDRVAVELLGTAEKARANARAGRGPGYLDRFLGPLAAPRFLLHPRIWSAPSAVPSLPFVGLRVYSESWSVEDRARDPRSLVRALVYEYPCR